ncbi:MAG: PEP-CTERM sorting domain-containing protein [Planctomycetota bacterium]|nr:PEP-CTERM sorting domain-containing protein [Planctomycetota bacterium]MDA1213642.1 PEP-CTERM sorting domain-containing protein [Planctomycetota bacterium]
MRSLLTLGFAGLLAVLATPSLEAANITVTQGSTKVRAWDGVSTAEEETLVSTLPMDTTSVQTDGLASNSSTFEFSNFGFKLTVVHSRPNLVNSNQAQTSFVVPTRFTLDQDEDYSISGVYSQTGNGRLLFNFELTDVSPGGGVVFRNQQMSYNTAGESFTLGLLEGDATTPEKFLQGSLTGTLIAGRVYELKFNLLVQRWTAASAATANGFFNLQIGDAPDLGVPEPSTAGLALLGLIGAGMFYRRRS